MGFAKQVLTKEEPGIWQRLSADMQKLVKVQLLEGIKTEKDSSLNKKARPICRCPCRLLIVWSMAEFADATILTAKFGM